MHAPLVDIGCNLGSDRLFHDLDRILPEARAAGVIAQVVTGSSLQSSERALQLSVCHDDLFATAGSHPHHADAWHPGSHRVAFLALARQTRTVAVGETGLDYWRGFAKAANQCKSFSDQLDIAGQVKKPLFLHERDAFADFRSILEPALPELYGGVWHCFTADGDALDWALAAGLYIGITGWICDPERGGRLRDLVRHIPDDRLLLETDAPYLTPKTLQPTPRCNEPKYLPEVLRMVAQCRGQDAASLARMTTANAVKLFALDLHV